MMTDIIANMVEVALNQPDDFLKIKETLTRIGVESKKDKVLYQSCHIIHKKGKYYICHFKELFMLDGRPADFSENDVARRNTIANLLAEWELLKLVDSNKTTQPICPINQIKIISFKDKQNWRLESKYQIGRKVNVHGNE